jgi:2-methylcitrate dehydratase
MVSDPSSQIKSVVIRMANIPFVKRQLEDIERRYPRTRETADHSFYYLTAVTLLDGAVTAAGFKKHRWLDADVKGMMERITIVADDALNARAAGTFPCVLEFVTHSSESRSIEMIHAPGSAKNRMSDTQVEAKFRHCCGTALPAARQDAVIEQVRNLEKLDSVASLMRNLQP